MRQHVGPAYTSRTHVACRISLGFRGISSLKAAGEPHQSNLVGKNQMMSLTRERKPMQLEMPMRQPAWLKKLAFPAVRALYLGIEDGGLQPPASVNYFNARVGELRTTGYSASVYCLVRGS